MFQFQCPNSHLLEGDESQAGQQCTCPTCGILFIIPSPVGQPSAPASPPGHAAPQVFSGIEPPGTASSSTGFPKVGPDGPSTNPFKQQTEPDLLHIPCPNGHELETPKEMLGQDVLCPHCNVQFQLREKDSVEYKRKRAAEIERRERKAGQNWLNWAITIAVLVIIGILGLIFAQSG